MAIISNSLTPPNGEVYNRVFLSDEPDTLPEAANFSYAMMGGNDSLFVIGGVFNFANGNNGDDQITTNGGQGTYLGGAGNDRLDIWSETKRGSWFNGNNGNDIVTGNAKGITYRGGADNDWMRVSVGSVWGDRGSDIFQAMGYGGEGGSYASVKDYTPGEDFVLGSSIYSLEKHWTGNIVYRYGDSDVMVFEGITDASQITVIDETKISWDLLTSFSPETWSQYTI